MRIRPPTGVVGITDHETRRRQGVCARVRLDPDMVVEQEPAAVLRGSDPQLERVISELMNKLPASPAGLPKRPAPPIKAEAP